MVHELIGLEDNRVDLGPPTGAKAKSEAQQLVLSQEQDAFFKANMYVTRGSHSQERIASAGLLEMDAFHPSFWFLGQAILCYLRRMETASDS